MKYKIHYLFGDQNYPYKKVTLASAGRTILWGTLAGLVFVVCVLFCIYIILK